MYIDKKVPDKPNDLNNSIKQTIEGNKVRSVSINE